MVPIHRRSGDTVLCIIVTDFGLIQTETLYLPKELSGKQIQKMEEFFLWKLGRGERPKIEEEGFCKLAQYLYNETIVRHLINSIQSATSIYHTGLAKLLSYPEFKDPSSFANALHLFEDLAQIRPLLGECCKVQRLSAWIGDELAPFSPYATDCAILCAPYYIRQLPVGAVALLGPSRMPYPELFGILDCFCKHLCKTLTKNVSKFKINFHPSAKSFEKQGEHFKNHSSILLENKSQARNCP